MRVVSRIAIVDVERCNGCATCEKICPVVAIKIEKHHGKRLAVVDQQECQGCTICSTRCPEEAIAMGERDTHFRVGIEVGEDIAEEVAEICRKAHMYPDQVICYCHRIQAKELAAAIIKGAKTPEEVAKMTGVRTGCGVLCITGVLRVIAAAGIELQKAPGHQWYGQGISIWTLSDEVLKKYDNDYYLLRDREEMDKMFPGGKE